MHVKTNFLITTYYFCFVRKKIVITLVLQKDGYYFCLLVAHVLDHRRANQSHPRFHHLRSPPRCFLAPFLSPVLRPRRRQEERGTVCFLLLFLRFCFPDGIDRVEAAMACWNKVCPTYPYLDDIRSGTDERTARVCVARSIGSLRILAVYVSIKGNRLAIGAATFTS